MGYSKIQRVKAWERKLADLDARLKVMMEKREAIQGKLDEILAKGKITKEEVLKSLQAQKEKVAQLEGILDGYEEGE